MHGVSTCPSLRNCGPSPGNCSLISWIVVWIGCLSPFEVFMILLWSSLAFSPPLLASYCFSTFLILSTHSMTSSLLRLSYCVIGFYWRAMISEKAQTFINPSYYLSLILLPPQPLLIHPPRCQPLLPLPQSQPPVSFSLSSFCSTCSTPAVSSPS